MNEADEFVGLLHRSMSAAFLEHERIIEQALLDALGAPIFSRLMIERQLNPLGIERWQDDIDLQTFAGDSIRFEQRVAFMQTRPYPRRLV